MPMSGSRTCPARSSSASPRPGGRSRPAARSTRSRLRCESEDPFGDGTTGPGDAGPLTIAYDAPAPFSANADIVIEGDLPIEVPDAIPLEFGDFNRVAAQLDVTDIPSDFTVYVGSPAEAVYGDPDGNVATATRVRTVAPGASNTNIQLGAQITTEGADCADPNTDGGAICADVEIDSLPDYASVLFATLTDPGPDTDPEATDDDEVLDTQVEFHACDRHFFAAVPACVGGTQSEIGVIDVDVRAHAGSTASVPAYVPPNDGPLLYAVGDLDDLANFELQAGLRVEELREIVFRKNTETMHANTDIGNGIKPLRVHVYLDTRDAASVLSNELLRAQATADITLTPLPQQIRFDQSGPGQNQTQPVEIEVEASETSVLNVVAEVRQEGVAEGADCGVRGTYCAEINVDSLPNLITARIDRDASAPVNPVTNTRPTQNQIHVDQLRFPGQGPEDKADITVHAAVGLPFEAPIVGDGPLFADLVLTGVPDHISMAMDSLEVIDPTSGDAILDASTLERFQVHTCNRDFENETCLDNSVSPLDQLDASVRSFDLRPTDFPAPPSVADAPFYIGASGRGNLLEAVARFTEVSEVQFLNRGGMTAATAKAGGGADFQVRVDIEDLPLGSLTQTLDLGFIEIADPAATIKATVDITPFPGDLSFCMREGGLAMPGDSPITFTDTCEQTDPFDADGDDSFTDVDASLTHTPLSIGFDANTSFDVTVDAAVAIDGVDPDTLDALPQQRAFGRLALEDLPSDLALHFLQPVPEETQADPAVIETSGPYHGILRTPGATSGLDVTLAAGYLVGADTICEDPRPNRSATCVSMGEFDGSSMNVLTPGIANLPTDAEFFYNPDLDPYSLTEAQLVDDDVMTNFTIHTEGTAATEFNKLRISTVNPPLDLPAIEVPLLGELATDAFIAEIDLDPLPDPFDVRGTLLLTDEAPTATFEVLDGATPGVDAIPGATVHVQNFLSPDPTTGVVVPPRPVEDVYAPPNQTYTISAIQRGPAVRFDAQLPRVQSFGIRPVRSGEDTSSLWRHPMGTTVINAGFEGDFNIRAYADLQPNPGLRIIGDVLIGDIPRETDVCIRGPRATDPELVTPLPFDDEPIPGTGTWCDDEANIEPGEGGLEIAQTPNTFGRKMDIDAFARLEFGGGSSVIAGRVDIRQMPQVVRARFGGSSGKDFELNTYEYADALGNLSPAGINRISFEAANFDLADSDTGYLAGQLPYSPLAGNLEAKEAPGGGGTFGGLSVPTEFLHAAADLRGGTDLANIGFHVRGQIGLEDSNLPSARLSHLLFSGDPCEVPVIGGSGSNANDPRGDYPDIPEGDPAGYTCIRTDFFEDTGVNPLLLDAIALLPGDTAVRLHDAGISDLPPWIQVQLAEAETFTDPVNQRGWRRPCPSIDDNRPGGCMAPLMRFDQPATTFLYGQAEFGRISDFDDFDDPATDPVMPAPDFDALPNGADWANDPTADSPDVGDRNNYDTGIRAKVLLYDGNTPLDFADDRIAARAGLRIQIPGSIQVEQIQNFDLDLRQKNQDGEYIGGDKASDMRMAFTTRLPGGALQESIGDLAAMVHMVDSGAQILLTQPCPSTEDILDDQETEARVPCAEYNDGIPLPGHVAMTMYLRNHLENVDVGPDGDDKLRSSTFVQIDGRISAEMNIGARLYGNGVALMSGGPTEGVFTGDGAVTAGTAEVAIRNLPSSGSTLGAHVYDPDFRFRAEIISDGDRPSDDPDPSTFSESGEVNEENDCNPDLPPEDPDGCLNEWFEFNFTYNVGIERAFVAFDMHPAGSATGPAKSLDAVIHLNTPQIGADLQAWDNIDRSGPAEISLGVGVAVSPLDFEVKSHSNVGANLDALVHRFITETIGGPDWLADIIGFIIKPITALIDAILNSLPIGIELESDFYLQFSVNRLSEFRVRNNMLHALMDGEGEGYANFGPINWYIDKFSGGLYFDVPNISIPDWICWVPGIPCNINPPAILLLGYGYADGFPLGSLGIPILMDFRDCDAARWRRLDPAVRRRGPRQHRHHRTRADPDPITSFFTGGDDEDFVIWVGTDPRMSFGGLLFRALDLITFGGFTTALDFVLDLLVGPIVCNIDFFSVDQEDNQFVGIDHSSPYYGTPSYYHPGMPDANKFPGHPVPGQPGVDNVLAEADETPPAAPVPEPPNDPSAPPPTPTPPDPPTDGLPDLYSGPTGIVSANTAMCGVHEFDSLTVNSGVTVSVATAANGDTSLGTGPACAASEVGYLEIRANTITIDGTINADFISDDIPDLVPDIPVLLDGDGNPIVFDPPLASPQDFEALYRATGNSGGTNAGVGANGTVPEAGFQNYEGGTEDTTVYQGGPGSSVGTGYDLDGNGIAPDVPGLFDSAGAGGNGGGTVVLLADTAITVNGTVTADGQNGVGDTFGACDDNPDDFNGPGVQTYDHDSDTNTAEIPRPIVDDPDVRAHGPHRLRWWRRWWHRPQGRARPGHPRLQRGAVRPGRCRRQCPPRCRWRRWRRCGQGDRAGAQRRHDGQAPGRGRHRRRQRRGRRPLRRHSRRLGPDLRQSDHGRRGERLPRPQRHRGHHRARLQPNSARTARSGGPAGRTCPRAVT